MTASVFDELTREVASGGVEKALARLADRLTKEGKFHELFDVRLMEARYRLGLPIILTSSLDDLPEPARGQLEEICVAIYRDVGMLLLGAGRIREAWMYLRPVGRREEIAAALAEVEPNDQNRDEIIEVALHEGMATRLGFELLLAERGLCNAITTYDGMMHQRPVDERREVAELLVRSIHADLLRNVRAEIAAHDGAESAEATIAELTASRDWLFENHNYHVDATHLAAVVRFALVLEDGDALRLAIDLTQYGRRLDAMYQFAGQPPFVDIYPSHGLWFRALAGEDVEEAVAYFRERADGADVESVGSGPAEVHVALLARLGRLDDALDAAERLIPAGASTTGFAPSLLELARLTGRFDRLQAICRERDDVVGYTAGLLEATARRT